MTATISPHFIHMWGAFMKAMKAVSAIMIYILAIYCTFVAETLCIAASYVLPQTTTIWMWTAFLLCMSGLWACAGWMILLATVEKKRDDAHLVLIPIAFMAVCAVGVASLFAAFAAMNTAGGLDALGFAIMFAALAAWALHFLVNEAVKTWCGVRTRFN